MIQAQPDLIPDAMIRLANDGIRHAVVTVLVTAGLKVNGNLHAPLLCVDNVFKVASGNLSLPGKVMPAK